MQEDPIRETTVKLRYGYCHTLLVFRAMRLHYHPLFQPHVERGAARPALLELAEALRFSVALRWILS